MKAKTIVVLFAMLAAVPGLALYSSQPAHAGTGLVYQAVDADNDPYSGIYLRDGTSMGNVRRITSRYMYYGNSFELICGTWGESVGPYANRRWHNVRVINGPAAGQNGWIADRYTSTPNKANEYTPGEPECGAPAPPPAPAPVPVPPAPAKLGAAYYSPYELGDFMPTGMESIIGRKYWSGSSCSSSLSKVGSVTPTYNANTGRTVTTLAGWSLGRMGPVYYLKAHPEKRSTIDYWVIIDPGAYGELRDSCDNKSPAPAKTVIREWLEANPNAHLVVFAGAMTRDKPTAVGSYAHRGLQEIWFKELRDRNSPARNRVMVCNYQGNEMSKANHEAMFWNFHQFIDEPRLSIGTCPQGGTYWHP